jgi:hypothetical protein
MYKMHKMHNINKKQSLCSVFLAGIKRKNEEISYIGNKISEGFS